MSYGGRKSLFIGYLKKVWSILLGGTIGWMFPNQGIFQRFLAVPKRRDGQM